MNTQHLSTRTWVAVVVIAHLIVSVIHGTAHTRAQVAMSTVANVFIFVVILAGPIVGLLLLRRSERAGGALIAATLAASFVFGLVNHFLLPGRDHVSHVAEQARLLFTATAVLLAMTEAVGAVLALRLLRHRMGVEM